MRRQILARMLSVTALAIVLFGAPLAVVVQRFVDEDATRRVERQAVLSSREVSSDFATSDDPVELPESTDGISIGLYDTTGSLIAGTGAASADPIVLQALANEIVDVEDGGVRVVAVPVAADERVIGVVRAEQSTSLSDARTRRILAFFGGLAVLVLGAAGGLAFVLAGRLTRPVLQLRDAAVRLGEGDFAIDVPRSRVPELDEAAEAMTATAHRLDDLVSRERSFSADASHQLRTPLAGLRAAIETELEFPRQDPTVVLHEALSDIGRLDRTIAELLTIARSQGVADTPVQLGEVFPELDQAWRTVFSAAGRSLSIAATRYTPAVSGNAAMLRHALDVVIGNALQHGEGLVAIEQTVTDTSVVISISDEGGGFQRATSSSPTSVAPTEKPLNGMGLPLAERLVEAMGGRVTVKRPGRHPSIEIILRRADSTTA